MDSRPLKKSDMLEAEGTPKVDRTPESESAEQAERYIWLLAECRKTLDVDVSVCRPMTFE